MEAFLKYLNSATGIDINTIATIIITLTVFILGYILNSISKSIKLYYERRNFRIIFRELTSSITKSCAKQSINFKDYLETLDVEYDGNFHLKSGSITHLDTFEKIDFKSFYSAYFTGIENLCSKKKLRAFNTIFSVVSNIRNTEDYYPKQLTSFINKFNEHENHRNENLEEFRKFMDEVLQNTNGQKLPKRLATYLTRFDRIVHNWQNTDNRTHYHIAHTSLVNPLLELNREFQDLPVTLQFNNYLLSVDHFYNSMSDTLMAYYDIFNSYKHHYRKSSKLLDKSVEILS